MLADIYGVIVNETADETYTEKLDKLSKNNPALENAALQQMYALVDSHYRENVNIHHQHMFSCLFDAPGDSVHNIKITTGSYLLINTCQPIVE